MRILIVNIDYRGFLESLYSSHPGLENASYEEQMRARNSSLFGVADFYSSNIRALGGEAWDIHANNAAMQTAWAREHGLRLRHQPGERWRLRLRKGIIPWISRLDDRRWMYEILAAQIAHYRPDVVLNQALDGVSAVFLGRMKSHTRLLAGQVAAPLDQGDLSMYDLIISSLPNFIDRFRKMGIESELSCFAFEPRILDALAPAERSIGLSFVGSISRHHASRVELMEYLCERFDIDIWGKGVETLRADSPVLRRHHGPAWGIEMYRALAASRITLNHHIDVAGSFANNMRLFEATGSGALLVTDWKQNLDEIFEPGKEVVAYRSAAECAEMISYYLEHDAQRAAIAAAGQQRTLSEHTYKARATELIELLDRRLRAAGTSPGQTSTSAS